MQKLEAIDAFMSSRFPSPENTGGGCPHVQKQVREAIAQSHFRLEPQKIDSTPKVVDFMHQNGVSEKAVQLYQWMTQFVGTPLIVIPRGIRMLK